MQLLLDTHIALWAVTESARLPNAARALIEDERNEVHVSVASLWEIAIKHAFRAKAMPFSAAQAHEAFVDSGYVLVDIETPHVLGLEALEPLHRDPFDRILVAQARTFPLRLLTVDEQVARYDPSIILLKS